jgi:hypothetical protein
MYLISLGIKYYHPNILENLSLTFISGTSALLLYTFLGKLENKSHQVGLILAVLFQILLFLSREPSNDIILFYYLRLTFLTLMVIIVSANYVKNSRHLGFEFWTVMDMLVLLIFIGLVVLRFNGLDVELWKWTEVILFYYSLALYIQQRKQTVLTRSLG